jgi:hypothetical protein
MTVSPSWILTCAKPTHENSTVAAGSNGLCAGSGGRRVGEGNVSASPKGRPRKDDATPGRDAREGIERGAAERAALPAPKHSEKNCKRQ